MINNALVISGGILLGLTKLTNSVTVLLVGRILVGVNAGIISLKKVHCEDVYLLVVILSLFHLLLLNPENLIFH